MRILSIGEAMVELGQSDQPGLWRLGIAGDTLNTAWYLRRLLGADWQVDYLSRVGQGAFSQQMVDFLVAEGIGATHVGRDPDREIGLYAISLKDGERSFAYWRDTSAAKRLADDPAALDAALDGAGVAYFSGITVAILPPQGRANLLAALGRAKAAGTWIVFDPNLRPRLWTDTNTMHQGISDAAAGADLVLPSFDDEATHFGDADPQATVARYLALGAGQVVVKNGGGPISFGGAGGSGVIDDLAPETPVDSTAAGDSFNAGYLAASLSGADCAAAIAAGHDLSRKVIRHRGALVQQAVAEKA
ncbi:sugar kinase [Paracoccus aerius]|uniref:Sugar kinase n=1 Tax=Paracoccus aerius TaxID=1915382 RepID=A0ABS1S8M7_9RHOB|nr:sugar kinase [Paracoccus aerius]MBL3674454.1 sugar kinase [Paracoccus aerius]GHG26005.1 2-dehydro-3-deoxygluconokinase [Paracoccus aerius]